MEPVLLQFDKENVNNEYVNFRKKLKPQITFYDGFTKIEQEKLLERRNEIDILIKNAIYEHFMNENSENSFCVDRQFPDRAVLSGNYYIASISYDKAIRDEDCYYEKKGERYQALSSSDGINYPFFEGDIRTLKCYYRIMVGANLTSREDGVEKDYLGIDFRLEFENIDDKIEWQILSTYVA